MGKDACDQLAAATTDDIVSSSAALRKCFSALMNSSQESISGSLQRFLQRIPSLGWVSLSFAHIFSFLWFPLYCNFLSWWRVCLFESVRVCALSGPDKKESLLCELFCRISTDFPADVGCWSVYFLNFVTLQENQSLFLGPNVPHAYISGGIVLWYLYLFVCNYESEWCVCVFPCFPPFFVLWLKFLGYHPAFVVSVCVCVSEQW